MICFKATSGERPIATSARAQKLAAEVSTFSCSYSTLGHILTVPPPQKPYVASASTRHASGASALHVAGNSDKFTAWLPRTDISAGLRKASTSKWEVVIKPLGHDMRTVLSNGFSMCAYYAAFGHPDLTIESSDLVAVIRGMNSLMSATGIKELSMRALIAAAEQLGYDGEGDIAHQLEDGDKDTYIYPLRSYVRRI